ncbi:MAG: hypothetical protein KKB81_02690 [Candidatus Margulisbacteria bacterium]|nr:hypothetical protein [Candidatus Margulisiibacteriota bacterium]MBU1022158.1 hypothetical protein [Candidatus Margulisiibacteriota bacterium]MBU1729403.1 hypothetical protein [Candidatus Margulisiibacteriota bacterium]MBU1955676.1 hypothetical protein [Candidatus Margulisiibacteriota bacterium]
MDFAKKIFVAVFVIFLVGLFAWAIFSPKQDFQEKIEETLEKQKERADLKFIGVTFSETVGGVKYWELEAKTATLNNDTETADLLEVNGSFFEKNTAVLKFIAPKVFWNRNQKEIIIDQPFGYDRTSEKYLSRLKRQVNIKSGPAQIFQSAKKFYGDTQGAWFKATRLNWKLKTKKLSCDKGIVLNQGALTIYAQNLDGDVAFKKLSLTGNPSGLFISNDKEIRETRIFADEFLVNAQKNEVSAINNVRILSKDTKIESKKLSYRRAKEELVISGSVKITYKDIDGQCEKAAYNPSRQIITLEDKAQVKRDKNIIFGKKIQIDLENDVINVSGKTKIVVDEEVLK